MFGVNCTLLRGFEALTVFIVLTWVIFSTCSLESAVSLIFFSFFQFCDGKLQPRKHFPPNRLHLRLLDLKNWRKDFCICHPCYHVLNQKVAWIFLKESTQGSKKSRKTAKKDLMKIYTTVVIKWTNALFQQWPRKWYY